MFGVVKKTFSAIFLAPSSFSTKFNSLECITMKNQECKERPKIINSALYYSFSITVSKCSGSCNSISDPYFKECISDVIRSSDIWGRLAQLGPG